MTNEQAKHKAIQEAYGKIYDTVKDYLSEDGWCGYYDEDENPLLPPSEIYIDHIEGDEFYRPRSLSGIENNNGWNRIETVDDLPKEDGEYEIISRIDGSIDFFRHRLAFNGLEQFIKYASHWKQKTAKPIY